MPRKHDDLFDGIARFRPLLAAARRAILGKRKKPGAAAFMANLEGNVLRLERELNDGTYRPGRYVEIEIFEPKRRIVSAAPFRDRVVHHAFCAVVEPIFERGFVHDSYANRAGKGTHEAVARYERYRDRHRHFLRGDIYRYFPAIDHAILKRDLRRRVVCERTLRLADTIVDASNPQEPVNLYFPGDDLFAPMDRRRGLPIGNLTSQFFANVYLDGMDHYCREILRAPGYVRYVDDFALFHDDPDVLRRWRDSLVAYLVGRRLRLHPRKTFIAATADQARFLGYDLLPLGRRMLAPENVVTFRNRLRSLRDRYAAGTAQLGEVRQRVTAWIAHASNADTWRLRRTLFRGGMFDPARQPGHSPVAWSGAAPGTTIPGTCARPTATGTTPGTTTTTTASAWPARTPAGAAAPKGAAGAHACVQERP